MKIETIPFCKTGYFSSLICDYLAKDSKVTPFYVNYPDINGFKKQLEAKRNVFSAESRIILVDALKKQFQHICISDKTKHNLESLSQKNTFTVTTGHQLNLFTGPLYFLYKIVTTINLAKQLKNEFPEDNFVPIYWMAAEDHDFDEINYFNFNQKKIIWNRKSAGAVGHFSTDGLEEVYKDFENELENSDNAQYLKKLFKKAYLDHDNLTEATRYLANELFGKYGLVIVDGDDIALKKQFIPYLQDELLNFTSFKEVTAVNNELEKDYFVQVNPREINLFYLTDTIRERIIIENKLYKTVDTRISWTKDELLLELEKHPERFSPNVLLRPLYQEVVLPNLCYIGGGGELAYWLQLKNYFNAVKVSLPILLLRNSVLIVSEKQQNKLTKLGINNQMLFVKQNELVKIKTKELSDIDIDFTPQKNYLKKQFTVLYKIAEQTDKSFLGAVKAQEVKQIKGLENLEKRLLKAEKRKLKDQLERITLLQNELFPKGGLQERTNNFSKFYLHYGEGFITDLMKNLDPLQLKFTILAI